LIAGAWQFSAAVKRDACAAFDNSRLGQVAQLVAAEE
jgi:hypothetical protein